MGMTYRPPDGVHVHEFRVGPLSAEQIAAIPERIIANIEAVRAGVRHENDRQFSIIADPISLGIKRVTYEIFNHIEEYLRQHHQYFERGLRVVQAADLDLGMESTNVDIANQLCRRSLIMVFTGIGLYVEEVLMNHILHGNKGNPEQYFEGKCWFEGSTFHMWSRDCGDGFSVESVDDPLDDANLERPCGRGLMLMNTFMDSVEFGTDGETGEMGSSVHGTFNVTAEKADRGIQAALDSTIKRMLSDYRREDE